MPSLKKYTEFSKSVPVLLITGETLTLSYCPAHYTAQLHQRNQDEDGLPDAEFLLAVATGWDFTDEKGKTIPITQEVLEQSIAISDRANMVKAVFEDLFPNVEKASSVNSSSPSPDTVNASGRT